MTTRGTTAPPPASGEVAKPLGSTWRGFANLITISRLGLIPVILFCLEAGFTGSHQIAAGLFIVGAATDSLDGMVARRRQEVSTLGIFLDPLADKLLVIAALFPLVSEGVLPAWAGFVIVAREVAVVILRTRGTRSGISISANRVAKFKTLSQDVMVVALILQRPYHGLGLLAGWLVAVAVIFTVWSGGVYLWRFRSLMGWR
ncbi:MAG TPA: CDP-diacylglycerol--glycerol-3-phosphate 3-phosphatidyltransferase [Candidatus Acidoferrales bacterium]|nr:CDP-diacylglycerol--glycerol-3-phosphate 3-phosphatidyltransferase [Candidatus Acidoferrales bacterium]